MRLCKYCDSYGNTDYCWYIEHRKELSSKGCKQVLSGTALLARIGLLNTVQHDHVFIRLRLCPVIPITFLIGNLPSFPMNSWKMNCHLNLVIHIHSLVWALQIDIEIHTLICKIFNYWIAWCFGHGLFITYSYSPDFIYTSPCNLSKSNRKSRRSSGTVS